MADGKSRESWQRTSTILALIANVNKDPNKGRPFKPADFDPYASKHESTGDKIRIDNLGLLKSAFVKDKKNGKSLGSGNDSCGGCGDLDSG